MAEKNYLDKTGLSHFWSKIKSKLTDVDKKTVHYIKCANSILGTGTSPYRSTEWKGTDDSITELYDGLTVAIKIDVASIGTYGAGLNINDLGIHPVVYGTSSSIGTRYPTGSVITLTYDSEQSASLYFDKSTATSVVGCWKRSDYDSTETTLLRHNIGTFLASTVLYRYKLLLTKNETTLLPTDTSNNSTGTTKTLTTDTFNPFGEIMYYNATTTVKAGSAIAADKLYTHIRLDLRYSFNTGSTLTNNRAVYLVCKMQDTQYAKLHTSPITQTLPTTEDGLIYIYLGHSYSTYQIELEQSHPIYEFKNGCIRQYSSAVEGGGSSIDGVPTGSIFEYDGTTVPDGYTEVANSELASIFKICYPVGSYYWSSENLSPVDLYGSSVGTWERLSGGQARVLISEGSLGRKDIFAGDVGGEWKHYITTEELPSHTHNITYSKSATSTGGTTLTAAQSGLPSHSHLVGLKHSDGQATSGEVLNCGLTVNQSDGRNRYNVISTGGNSASQSHNHSITLSNSTVTSTSTGGSEGFELLPPYLVAYCWHRTA